MKNIKQLILQRLKDGGILKASDIVKKYSITRQAVNKHINALIRERKIIKQGTSKATAYYVLNDDKFLKKIGGEIKAFKKHLSAKNLFEDKVFDEIKNQAGFLDDLNEKGIENFQYSFTEMLNNAIDHSNTKFIDINVAINKTNLFFEVIDKGVGIFENIIRQKNLNSELEAIQDLLKGKNTTMPEKHSGEGIFFTSKIADKFTIESHRKKIIIDNRLNDIFIEDIRFLNGTKVSFEMDMPAKKTILDIFKDYTNESFSFDKSKINVKLFDDGEAYISRSQAKRLLHSLENFHEIILDFSGVKTVGQAFADEIFRVFQTQNPGIKISAINYNENIEFMIKRAREGAGRK